MTKKNIPGTVDNILDTETLLHNCEGDLDFLEELIHLFLEDSPKQLARINESIKNINYSNLQISAHTLKGAAGHFGASALTKTARKLEMMGKKKELRNAENLYLQVEEELDKTNQALKQYLKDNKK